MKYQLNVINMQELGQRANQEDSLYPALGKCSNDNRLFLVCDGMGGHEKGEVASATVCDAMSNYILQHWSPEQPLSDEVIKEALSAAYDELDKMDNGELRKMGTTMTFLCFHADGVTVAHIGDSRVYQIRPNTKEIIHKTRDHSLVNDLIAIGEITEEEALTHPQKNVITRAMQPGLDPRPKADIKHLNDVKPGDVFYMCTDGMLEQTPDENVLNILALDKTNEELVEILTNVTANNHDNHTAYIIRVMDVKGKPVTVPATPVSRPNAGNPNVTVTPIGANTKGASIATPHQDEDDKIIKIDRSKLLIIIAITAVLAILAIGFSVKALFFNDEKGDDKKVEPKTEVTQEYEQQADIEEYKEADIQPQTTQSQETTQDVEAGQNSTLPAISRENNGGADASGTNPRSNKKTDKSVAKRTNMPSKAENVMGLKLNDKKSDSKSKTAEQDKVNDKKSQDDPKKASESKPTPTNSNESGDGGN